MLDKNLLHALRTRKRYDTLYPYVPLDMFSPDTRRMLEYFGLYFKSYPDHAYVELEPLETMIKLKCKPTPEQLGIFRVMVQNLQEQVSPEVITSTIEQLNTLRYQGKLGILLTVIITL